MASSFLYGRLKLISVDATISTNNQLSHVKNDLYDMTTSTTTPSTPITLYHEMRTDRSGSVIYDMLLAHAYAYSLNTSSTAVTTYGGACYYNETTNSTGIEMTRQVMLGIRTHRQFVHALGLDHILHFVPCPTTANTTAATTKIHSDTNNGHNENILFVRDRHVYLRYGTTRLWTTEWVQHIRSQQQKQQPPQSSPLSLIRKNNKQLLKERSVVVHIRRNDVSLCDENTFDRYLPNSYYQTLLQRYTNNDTDRKNRKSSVTIYSESNSTESWSAYDPTEYTLKLDEPPIDVWHAIMNADLVILSWSSFSVIPALFNRIHEDSHGSGGNKTGGAIIYTPFWIKIPITTPGFDNWIAMDHDTLRNMRRTKVRLRQELCDVHKHN